MTKTPTSTTQRKPKTKAKNPERKLPSVEANPSNPPKRQTKQAQLIALLGHKDGADIAALSKALGWQAHTVRAALSRLRQAGYVFDKFSAGSPLHTYYRIESGPADAPEIAKPLPPGAVEANAQSAA